tara:strand:+ start:2954 stop:4120 length:1167 start_codon:yes stop_codon:yes gene_type:complete
MDNIDEEAPPYWGHTKADKSKGVKVGGTAEAMKKAQERGDIPKDMNIFALMWSMKNQGDTPHYKPGKKGVLKKKYKGPEGQNEGIIMNNQTGTNEERDPSDADVKRAAKEEKKASKRKPSKKDIAFGKDVSKAMGPKKGTTIETLRDQIQRAGQRGKEELTDSLDDHIEYKRIGFLIAEAMGYRIDEFVLSTIGGLVGDAVYGAGRAIKGTLKGAGAATGGAAEGVGDAAAGTVKGVKKVKKALTREEEEAEEEKRKKQLVAHTEYNNKYLQALKEAHQAHIDPEAKKEIAAGDPAGGYAGPVGRRYGTKRSSSHIRDPLVKRHAQGAKRRLDKKLGVKTNPQAQHMVQAAMLHKRKTETPGLGRERASDARADAARDKWRRSAPGDK